LSLIQFESMAANHVEKAATSVNEQSKAYRLCAQVHSKHKTTDCIRREPTHSQNHDEEMSRTGCSGNKHEACSMKPTKLCYTLRASLSVCWGSCCLALKHIDKQVS
jgi:hypothetical protein